jgi:hypothetical protein
VKHPESTHLRTVTGFASEKAGAEPPDWAGASKALDMLDKLLGAAGSPSPGEGASGRSMRPPR